MTEVGGVVAPRAAAGRRFFLFGPRYLCTAFGAKVESRGRPTSALCSGGGGGRAGTISHDRARGDAADVVTLRASLTARMKQEGGRVLYVPGTKVLTDDDTGFKDAVTAAKQADVVLMALGEDAAWMTGEAASRVHLGLPGNQQQLLETVAATGKPVVLIVFSGRPLALPWAADHIPAILEAWFPGVEAGPALVRVLFGDVNPSGKLTVSMPRSVGQKPLHYDALNTGRPAD